MSNSSFSSITVGISYNIITTEPLSGQMTFQDSIITNPITLCEIVNNRNNIYTSLSTTSEISGNLQSQIDRIESTTTSITGDFQSQINNINNIVYGLSIVF